MALRITLDALMVIDAIDRRGSFAAAAAELHRVPSAITYTVQKLEQDLDALLFDRRGHRALLTMAGRKLLDDGRHLLRAAGELECSVKRVATGWESALTLAVGDIIPMARLFPLVSAFYAEERGTQIRLLREMLSGVWDALLSGRADIAIGATGEGPAGGGVTSRPLGAVTFVFVIRPTHPLAALPEPLSEDDILQYRAVAAADSSRNLAPVTSALLGGQEVFTVPDLETKVEAHRFGLGVGYVPRFLVADDLASGALVERRVVSTIPYPQLCLAWRTREKGKALKWFLDRLGDESLYAGIVDGA